MNRCEEEWINTQRLDEQMRGGMDQHTETGLTNGGRNGSTYRDWMNRWEEEWMNICRLDEQMGGGMDQHTETG